MKRGILNTIIFLVLALIYLDFNVIQDDDRIIWIKDRKLTWNDFKGVPPIIIKKQRKYGAEVNSGILESKNYKEKIDLIFKNLTEGREQY